MRRAPSAEWPAGVAEAHPELDLPRRRRLTPTRVAGLVAGVLLLGTMVVVALSIVPALSARRDLDKGSAQFRRGRVLLLAGDVAGARTAFSRALGFFREARSEAASPLLRLEGSVPILGRTPRALSTLALVGDEVAGAATRLTGTIARLPGGISSLLPSHDRFPVSAYRSLEPALASAVATLQEAQRQAGLVPTSFVLPQVRSAAAAARAEIQHALSLARPADAMLRVLPRLAEAGGTRHYLIGLLNPDELRGPGGFMGLYSVATFEDGRLVLGPFKGEGLRDLAPGPEWNTIAFDPDIPTVGRLLVGEWNRSLRPHLDGIVFLDPQIFPPLLRATGGVVAPGLHYRVNAKNAVAFTTNRAYFLYGDREARKSALGAIASLALRRFLDSPPPTSRLRAVLATARAGYLQVYSSDPLVEDAFREVNAAGAYGPRAPGEDFLGVVGVNKGGSKVDYYVRRSIRDEITLGPAGTAASRVSVTFANGAPTGQTRSEVFGTGSWGGGAPRRLQPGDDYGAVQFYCGRDCVLRPGATGLMVAPPSQPGSVPGLHSYDGTLVVKPQESQAFSFDLLTAKAWSGSGSGGTYRLRLQDQPVITPTTVTIVVHAPPGMAISAATPSMRVYGSEAVFRGQVRGDLELEVSFRS